MVVSRNSEAPILTSTNIKKILIVTTPYQGTEMFSEALSPSFWYV